MSIIRQIYLTFPLVKASQRRLFRISDVIIGSPSSVVVPFSCFVWYFLMHSGYMASRKYFSSISMLASVLSLTRFMICKLSVTGIQSIIYNLFVVLLLKINFLKTLSKFTVHHQLHFDNGWRKFIIEKTHTHQKKIPFLLNFMSFFISGLYNQQFVFKLFFLLQKGTAIIITWCKNIKLITP